MGIRAKLSKPTHIIYLLAHIVLLLVGVILWKLQGLFWQALGSSLIAGGITGWVVFAYVFVSQDTAERLEVLERFGLRSAFQTRGMAIREEYDSRLSRARHRIDVLGFGLKALREDYSKAFQTWKDRASVRVLLLDPDFPTPDASLATLRDAEEQHDAGAIARDVRKFVDAARTAIKNKGTHSFQIRLYRCLPSVNIFRIDDDLFWGPYFVLQPSRNTPTFLVRRGGHLFVQFEDHFNSIWESDELSRPVPREWLDK